MASIIPESFANSFATNVYGAGLSAHQGVLMAQYQQSTYEQARMSAQQQATMEEYIKRELEQQICEQVKKNIKVEKTKAMDSYSTNYTATFAGVTTSDATTAGYDWRYVYGGPYYQSQATAKFPEGPEPKPKPKKKLSFYKSLKAEIDGWLKGALEVAF